MYNAYLKVVRTLGELRDKFGHLECENLKLVRERDELQENESKMNGALSAKQSIIEGYNTEINNLRHTIAGLEGEKASLDKEWGRARQQAYEEGILFCAPSIERLEKELEIERINRDKLDEDHTNACAANEKLQADHDYGLKINYELKQTILTTRDELTAARSDLERMNKECISLFLHELRMEQALARCKRLKEALEQMVGPDAQAQRCHMCNANEIAREALKEEGT